MATIKHHNVKTQPTAQSPEGLYYVLREDNEERIDTYIVSNGKVKKQENSEEKINQLVDEDLNATPLFAKTESTAIRKENGTSFGSTYYKLHSLDVRHLTSSNISVRVRHTSDIICAIAFYNSATISADSFMAGESIAGSIGLKTYETIIPVGAVLVVISHSYAQGEQPVISLPVTSVVNERIGEVNDKITNTNNELKKNVSDIYVNKDYYFHKTGRFVSNTLYDSTSFVEIEPNTDLVVDCYSNSTTSPVTFFDENYNTISYLNIVNGSHKGLVIRKEEIPTGAKYIVVSDQKSENRTITGVKKTFSDERMTDQFNWFSESGYVNVEGKFAESTGYRRTGYMPVGDWLFFSTVTRLQVAHIAFFDRDKVFLDAIPGSGTDVYLQKTMRLTKEDYPAGAVYFIASTYTSSLSILQFNIPDIINAKSTSTDVKQFGSEKIFSNALPNNDVIYASHFSGILRRSPVLLPEMSVWSLQAANRAGFKYVQCNAALTSDGYRIMQHDIALNRTMTDLAGNDLVGEILSTDLTLEYIKSNFRYKSTNPRYRTEVLEMTEFLRLCAEYGIVPIFNNTAFSEAEFNIINGIVGDKFGIFQVTRSFDRENCRYIVYAWRGSTVDAPAKAVEIMDKIGKPAIYGAYANIFTKELSDALRKAGYLCAPASVYFENYWPNVKQFADFNVTDFYCPPFEGGDKIITSDLGWDDFVTNGTVENGLLVLEVGQTLSYESDENYYLGKSVLDVSFIGELRFKCCSMNPENGASYTYERGADNPIIQVTPSIVNDKATLLLTATKRTVINYVNFRIKKI